MKILVITRGKLELEKLHLVKPVITIGRSPTNDVVLRAPGVAPIHFIIEWIGSGEFDPAQSQWSISDISQPQSGEDGGGSGEGVILTGDAVDIGGFHFQVKEDHLEAKPMIGGKIVERLTKNPTVYGRAAAANAVLEVVQIRTDSGAVEEVRHIHPDSNANVHAVLKNVPEFRLQWEKSMCKLLTTDMPGAMLYNRGQKVTAQGFYQVQMTDVVQVRWRGADIFLRHVPRIEVPLVKREVFTDPLLKKLIGIAVVLFALLLAIILIPTHTVEKPIATPPRVATIEVKTVPDAVPPPPPEVEPIKPAEPDPVPPKPQAKSIAAPKQKSGGTAAQSRYKGEEKKSVGLNSPAPKGPNQVGILGALKGSGPKGPGVRADMVINNGVQTDAVSADSDTSVVVKNPPSGIIGTGRGGNPKGDGNLANAQTTFDGGDEYNPNASGPISRKGGRGKGFSVGDQLAGTGKGIKGGSGVGNVDIGSMNNLKVEGGLDRETVRRVIKGYLGQVRTCYEKALISNPSLNGRITYRWNISPSGPVTSVTILQSTVDSGPIESCVMGVIKDMQFPAAPNGKPTMVIYPFVFQARQ